ncbi:hypothetical protein ACQ3I4_06690 [Zafaria sp. Z1313]|uniref:hypothetical protein n=1 Tax=Zafaria sp. Z1313 TaxID=3423202 RepID=UPI003D30300A
MTTKKTSVSVNARTGSYTVHVAKSAQTGKFSAASSAQGRIGISKPANKSSK